MRGKTCANVVINNLMGEGMGVKVFEMILNVFEMGLNVSLTLGSRFLAGPRQLAL